MNARLLGLAMVVGLSLPVAAQAQMLAPGLWELTTSNMKVDNQDLPTCSPFPIAATCAKAIGQTWC
jgi:hypothetical protein